MSRLVRMYALSDLFFKENRLAVFFNVIQITMLFFALFILAFFLKGYSKYLNNMFNSPSYNRIILLPNLGAGYNFISTSQFQDIKTFLSNGNGPRPKAVIPRYEPTRKLL